MFNELVESTKQKPQGRNKFYLVTSLIYGTSLSVLAIATILWFNPAMAEATTSMVLLPPVPIPAPPPDIVPVVKAQPEAGFLEPKTPPKEIMDAAKVPPKPPVVSDGPRIVGAPPLASGNTEAIGTRTGPNFGDDTGAPPPLPAPKPTPKAEPTPTPTPKPPDVMKVSSVLLQGKAIQKVQPPYPPIAKAARVQGTVQVAILISQEGRVMSAEVVSGHPMLREAAAQAARQWVFSPTSLNGSPVKVSGVIAFNFTLN